MRADEELDKPLRWIFVGKYRAHYKPIVSIEFDIGLKESAEPAPTGTTEQQPYSLAASAVVESADGTRTVVAPTGKAGQVDQKHSAAAAAAGAGAAAAATGAASVKPPAASDFVFRLFSLGEDRVIQEFDVTASSIRQGLKLKVCAQMMCRLLARRSVSVLRAAR